MIPTLVHVNRFYNEGTAMNKTEAFDCYKYTSTSEKKEEMLDGNAYGLK